MYAVDGGHIVNVHMSHTTEPLPLLYWHCQHCLLPRIVCSRTAQGHCTFIFHPPSDIV